MAQGTLKVVLVSAKGFEDSDFLSGMDAYAILTCRTQEKKSSVASGERSKPEWNETFLFTISEDVTSLSIKLMDKDSHSTDDFIGEAIISLKTVFEEESIPPIAYNVVKDEENCGEIRVGLEFTQKAKDGAFLEKNFSEWSESSVD